MNKVQYDETYYLRGKDAGVSNYQDYRWLPRLTVPMARRLIDFLGIRPGSSLLDFGCARGYLVKALRHLWVDAHGCDISEWAIANCDPEVKDYVSTTLPDARFDYMVAKDVLEHLTLAELGPTLLTLTDNTRIAMLVIVPLTEEAGGSYVRAEDNMDATHQIRWPLPIWLEYMEDVLPENLNVSASWRCPGLKPACAASPKSCGFFVIRRL